MRTSWVLFLTLMLCCACTSPLPSSHVELPAMESPANVSSTSVLPLAPVFGVGFPTSINATETSLITLPTGLISEPNGDPLTVTFGSPFNRSGAWQTVAGDAGSYLVPVNASADGFTTSLLVHVTVLTEGTAPVLAPIAPITVIAGGIVHLRVSAYDELGRSLSVTIGGWLQTDTYQTTMSDVGVHEVVVTVSNGVASVSQVVRVTVTAPVQQIRFVLPS